MKQLTELQNRIHSQNVELGWWDNPRPFHTMVCLFHSESSEAMEGDRKQLNDDHLPAYPMFQVELADFVIRLLDYLGSTGFNESDWDDVACQVGDEYWSTDNTKVLADLHLQVSKAYDASNQCEFGEAYDYLGCAVIMAFKQAEYLKFSLVQIILEKVEYNKHRADHKRENRAADGGKRY